MSAEDSQNSAGNANAIADQLDRLNIDGEAVDATPRTEQEYAEAQLTLRAIVSSKEAGVIIGKAGKNVADLRDETGVRAGVSKVVQGVHDRVLSVTGSLSGISKAYGLVAKGLLEGAPAMGMGGVVRSDGTHRKHTPCAVSSHAAPRLLRLQVNSNSNSSSHLSQSDGHHHRSPGLED
jgi:heterogeneous nuclear rnp K-like protein 2